MQTPLCTTLYRAPTLACPHDGDSSSDPQLDVRMVLMSDELVFHFCCIAFHFLSEVFVFLQCPSSRK